MRFIALALLVSAGSSASAQLDEYTRQYALVGLRSENMKLLDGTPVASRGSGFLAGSTTVVTAAHVVGAVRNRVSVHLATGAVVYGTVVRSNWSGTRDYAVVRLDTPLNGWPTIPLSRAGVKRGAAVYCYGDFRHQGGTIEDVAARCSADRGKAPFFSVRGVCRKGFSGGPAVNVRGEAIGVVSQCDQIETSLLAPIP